MTENRESALLAEVPEGLFIGGQGRSAEGGATLTVQDPATGATIKTIASASVADGTAAMDAAAETFPAWAATPVRERAELLRRAFDLLQERKEDFALLMSIEMGKPIAEARGEVARPQRAFQAEHVDRGDVGEVDVDAGVRGDLALHLRRRPARHEVRERGEHAVRTRLHVHAARIRPMVASGNYT